MTQEVGYSIRKPHGGFRLLSCPSSMVSVCILRVHPWSVCQLHPSSLALNPVKLNWTYVSRIRSTTIAVVMGLWVNCISSSVEFVFVFVCVHIKVQKVLFVVHVVQKWSSDFKTIERKQNQTNANLLEETFNPSRKSRAWMLSVDFRLQEVVWLHGSGLFTLMCFMILFPPGVWCLEQAWNTNAPTMSQWQGSSEWYL